MPFTGLLVHDVVIVNPGVTEDRYHNEVKDWDSASRTDERAWVSQRGSSEVLGDRETQITPWVIFLEPDSAITSGARVEWSGHTFEVDGEPNHAWAPRGAHHIEAPLREVTEWETSPSS